MAKGKANAIGQKLRMEALLGQTKMELTEVEKATLAIVIERVNQLQAELQKAQMALSGLITQAVQGRGLDTLKFGVNLAAGRVLPVDTPPRGDGAKPE